MLNHNYLKNSHELELIFLRGITTLLDTSVFLGFSERDSIIDLLFEPTNFIDSKVLDDYNIYLSTILDRIDSHNWILTSPEIIDSKINKIRKIFEERLIGFKKLSLRKKIPEEQLKNIKTIIKIVDMICGSFSNLEQRLNLRLIENDFIPNQYYRIIYEKYQYLINYAYNKFKNRIRDDITDEFICADDSLIASALMLLMKKKSPIKVISNDTGVSIRLMIFNTLLSKLKEEKPELYRLLKSKGISIYNVFNENREYKLYGTTIEERFMYNIFKNKNWKEFLDHFRRGVRNINNLERNLIN